MVIVAGSEAALAYGVVNLLFADTVLVAGAAAVGGAGTICIIAAFDTEEVNQKISELNKLEKEIKDTYEDMLDDIHQYGLGKVRMS